MALRGDTEEYARQREFYRESARDSEFLEEIVKGDTTFKKRLDLIMKMYVAPMDFKKYLDVLAEQGATGLNKDELMERYNTLFWGAFKDLGQGIAIGAIGIGIFLSAVGPLFIVEPLIAAAGVKGIRALRKKRKYLIDTRKRKEEIFRPLYDAAESIDYQTGMCFLLNHFHDNRERFEETYRGMPQEEREEANNTLYGLLGVGGMKNMDQIKLDDYLSGVLAEITPGS